MRETCPSCGWTSDVVTEVRMTPDGCFQYRRGQFVAHTQHSVLCVERQRGAR